ncbi:MAG TPA: hypothetical protein VKE96_34430 [Vicinamibacterales bacterium]|nr:hypothetical protein [Vicinamibacterales bacterium]
MTTVARFTARLDDGQEPSSAQIDVDVLEISRRPRREQPQQLVSVCGARCDKLREELTLAQMDRHATEIEGLDVEGILAFAERVLPSAPNLWVRSSLAQKQRLQHVFFPDGIRFDGKKACWNRRNRTGFQLLAGDQNR